MMSDFPRKKNVRTSHGLAATIKESSGSIDPGLFPAITPLKAGFRKNLSASRL
jgi:hypothetical protein